MFWIMSIGLGIAMLLIVSAIGEYIARKDYTKEFEEYVLDSSDDEGRPRIHESFESWKERQ